MSVHNEEQYLYAALNSILKNRFDDFELIVVDDASTDKTLSILYSFETRFRALRIIKFEKRKGLAFALNHAIDKTNSNLIMRMDGDDLMSADRILCQYEYMKANPEVDILGSNVELIDDENKVIGKTNVPLDHHDICSKLYIDNVFAHPSITFRKASIVALGGYDVKLKRSQDYDLWRRALVAGLTFANTYDCLLKYRYQRKKRLSTSLQQYRSYLTIGLKHKDFRLIFNALITLAKNILSSIGAYKEKSLR